MVYPIPTVRAVRKAKRALSSFHVKWCEHHQRRKDPARFTLAALAYLQNASDAVLVGEVPTFTIQARDSVTCMPEVFYLDEDDFDWA